MDDLLQDLRYGLRTLMRNPGFTLVAVMTLALGIGVNTTLFSPYNAVALKSLPVTDAERIVRLKGWFKTGSLGDNQFAYSYDEYKDLRDHGRSFSGLIAVSWPLQVLGVLPGGNPTDPQLLRGQLASGNYFGALGVRPALGRGFTDTEDQAPGANPVVVLSHAFW